MNESVLGIILRKGIGESLYASLRFIIIRLRSYIIKAELLLRGFDIATDVFFRGAYDFSQSTQGAVSIRRGSIIGQRCRISAGFKGQIYIGERVLLDDNSMIMAQEKISIGDDTLVAPDCMIIDFDHNFSKLSIPIRDQGYATKPISIGKNVWIGTKSVILKGVQIGDGAIIGAGSIVTKNVRPYTIVAGNPAKMINKRA